MNQLPYNDSDGRNALVATKEAFFTSEDIQIIREAHPTLTDQEFSVAMKLAAMKRLRPKPFGNDIHFIKRWNPLARREEMVPQTGIDGYRLIAERTGEYDGNEEPEFAYDGNGKLTSAKTTIWRKGRSKPFSYRARYEEFVQTNKEGMPTSTWRKMPHVMLAKCSEANALRKAFPQELSGMYTAEEMGQSDHDHDVEGEVAGRDNDRGAISLDDTIPWGRWQQNTWREAASHPDGRQELGRIAQQARVQKYQDAAHAALAWWKEYEKKIEEQQQPTTNAAPTNTSTQQPAANAAPMQQAPKRGRPPKKNAEQSAQSTASAAPSSPSTAAAQPVTVENQEAKGQPAASTTPPAAPTATAPVTPPATPATAPKSDAKLYKEIMEIIGSWPDGENRLDEYFDVYSSSIAVFPQYKQRGLERVPLHEADEDALRKVFSHVSAIGRLWKLAIEKLGGDMNAQAWLDDKSREMGKREFFDPQMGRPIVDRLIELTVEYQPKVEQKVEM